jgi:DNA ligase-1
MKFRELAKYLDRLEKTASRIKITEILSELFKKSSVEEIDKTTYLILGKLAPNYRGIVFNVAERMMMRALADAYNVDKKEVIKKFKELGDLGDTSYKLAQITNHPPATPKRSFGGRGKSQITNFSVSQVYNTLKKIAEDEGEGSQERKIEAMADLLKSLDPLSARFVARIPVGKLRLGFSDITILDALSWMKNGDKSAKKELEKAYFVLPDVGRLAKLVKKMGVKKAVEKVHPEVVLAQRLKSPDEMIAKMGTVAVEPKYDGLRMLIHYRKAGYPKVSNAEYIRAFTRNMNLIETKVFPELTKIGKLIKANEVILDTEAVGMDPKRQRIVDFQKTMQRRRKHEVGKSAGEVPLQFQVFDILLKDGRSLLNETYLERRKELSRILGGCGRRDVLRIDEYEITDNPDRIRKLHKKYLKKGLEGVIVKRIDGKYVSGRTGWRWVKMKEEESAKAKLADTVDGVVMGYYAGRGKRSQFGLGGFLVGVLANTAQSTQDKAQRFEENKIYTLTKVGTGLTDEQFKELKIRLARLEVRDKPKEYGKVEKNLIPDVWVNPGLVVELAADEVTKSKVHSAGYALRFPRLVKFRDDKSPEQATTVGEIKKLFKLQ